MLQYDVARTQFKANATAETKALHCDCLEFIRFWRVYRLNYCEMNSVNIHFQTQQLQILKFGKIYWLWSHLSQLIDLLSLWVKTYIDTIRYKASYKIITMTVSGPRMACIRYQHESAVFSHAYALVYRETEVLANTVSALTSWARCGAAKLHGIDIWGHFAARSKPNV